MFRPAAHRRSRTAAAPRQFAWLLWLALLLPLAQAASACHVYSHTQDLAAGAEDFSKSKHASGASHCDLCLAGSLVHGGGLPAADLLLPVPPSTHSAPQAAFDSPWSPPLVLAYQGRAPPLALS